MTTPTATSSCPGCGAAASGRFCSNCGASLAERACPHCRADLSPQARFCHRCGREAGAAHRAAADRKAWLVAGVMCLLLVMAIIYKVVADRPAPTAPDMANAGSAGNPGVEQAGSSGPADLSGGPPVRGPDISAMGPRERFDRLFNRAMQASEQNKTDSAEFFSQMGLQAYASLDSISVDARYHAAVLRLELADYVGALALADTILRESPGHLFGYLVRGTAAERQHDSARLAQSRRDFTAHYGREMAARRVEYQEHKPALDAFHAAAGAR